MTRELVRGDDKMGLLLTDLAQDGHYSVVLPVCNRFAGATTRRQIA